MATAAPELAHQSDQSLQYEDGIQFIKSHGLRIIWAIPENIPQDKPYLIATMGEPLQLFEDKFGGPHSLDIVDPAKIGWKNAISMVLDVLSSEHNLLESQGERLPVYPLLDDQEPLIVLVDGSGWRTVFDQLQKEFPGQIVFDTP